MSGSVEGGLRHSAPPGLDWPLSLEEKKSCLLQLFSKDVQAANEVIRSGEEKLRVLELELQRAVEQNEQSDCRMTAEGLGLQGEGKLEATCGDCIDAALPRSPTSFLSSQPLPDESAQAAEKLREAIASATAALEALELAQGSKPTADDEWGNVGAETLTRARSDGNLVGILCSKDTKPAVRSASAGQKQRRVSFGPSDCGDDHARGCEPEPELFTPDKPKGPPQMSGGWCPSVRPLYMAKQSDHSTKSRDTRGSYTPRHGDDQDQHSSHRQRRPSNGEERSASSRGGGQAPPNRRVGGRDGAAAAVHAARSPANRRVAGGVPSTGGAVRTRRIWRAGGS
mmetsp:Transcript_50142/g.119363  ORF Transcript_50142/g.119363 Transcript_50142/m.119363 type:complete len:340 (+) Transcript_50142:100-1119(+)